MIAWEVAIMQSGQGAVVVGPSSEVDLHELTRRRAEEIYIRNGRLPGRDIENWTQAEEEIRAELERASFRTAIIVRVSGVHMWANTVVTTLMVILRGNSRREYLFPFACAATKCL